MAKYLFVLFAVLSVYYVQAVSIEYCKAYTDLNGTLHQAQYCDYYCCIQLSSNTTQCCSKLDDEYIRAPVSQRDSKNVYSCNWLQDHMYLTSRPSCVQCFLVVLLLSLMVSGISWVPIVVGLVLLISICICCCCCCSCCRNDKHRTVMICRCCRC